jgi:hypothetical protein
LTDFYIDFKCSSPLSHEEGKWITEIEAKISTFSEEDNETLAGKARFHLADIESALDAGLSAFWLLDEKASTFDMYSKLFVNHTSEFKDEIFETIGEELFSSNLFIVDRIEILPDFRGHSLARLAIEEAIRIFAGNVQLCVLKAFPLQFEVSNSNTDKWTDSLKLLDFCDEGEIATQKLIDHYKAIGFHSLHDSKEYMVRKVI